MNLLVATCYTPFHEDRNARLARELNAEFLRRGHQSDVILIPWNPHTDFAAQSLALRLFDLTESAGNVVDRLITLGEPAIALHHPFKISWSINNTRSEENPFFGTPRKSFYASLTDAKRFYSGKPLYPPLSDASGLNPAPLGEFYLWAGTLAPVGRAAHALEAMRFVHPSVHLTLIFTDFSITPNASSTLEVLRQRAREWDLTNRIEFDFDPSCSRRRELVRHCQGLLALHYDQPAPDDILIEALHAHRPILTFDDSGAAAGLIENGFNGVKHPPDPRMLAWDMNRLATDTALNQQLGEGAFATLAHHNIHWSNVAERLLS